MNTSKEDLDIIERYLNGDLSEDGAKIVKERLETDDDFKTLYTDYIKGRKAIEYALKNQLKEKVTKSLNEKKPTKTIWLKPISIAAGLIIVVAGAFWVFTQMDSSPQELYAEYFELPPTPNVRSQESSPDIQKALLAYQNRNYASADTLIQPLLLQENVSRKEELILVYAGTLLELNRDTEAIAQLKLIGQESALSQDAQWYLLMVYLKLNDPQAANEMLETIINTKNHYKLQEAEKILKSLN